MAYPVTRQSRDPYDWSLARPGEELHTGATVRHPPEHLDPHATGYATVPVQIRLDDERQTLIDAARYTMIGIAASVLLFSLGVAAIGGAVIRLPAIEQQLAYDART